MKNLLSFILLITMVYQYKSQILDTTPNANNTNNDINKFIGTWNWSSGGESLQLIFKKENILLPIDGNVKSDVLLGVHKFTKNNIIIEDTTQFINSTYIDKKTSLFGYTLENPNKLLGSIIHTSKNKSVKFEIDYIDSMHIKLIKVENSPGIKLSLPGNPYDSSISLPQNIILTKQ